MQGARQGAKGRPSFSQASSLVSREVEGGWVCVRVCMCVCERESGFDGICWCLLPETHSFGALTSLLPALNHWHKHCRVEKNDRAMTFFFFFFSFSSFSPKSYIIQSTGLSTSEPPGDVVTVIFALVGGATSSYWSFLCYQITALWVCANLSGGYITLWHSLHSLEPLLWLISLKLKKHGHPLNNLHFQFQNPRIQLVYY